MFGVGTFQVSVETFDGRNRRICTVMHDCRNSGVIGIHNGVRLYTSCRDHIHSVILEGHNRALTAQDDLNTAFPNFNQESRVSLSNSEENDGDCDNIGRW